MPVRLLLPPSYYNHIRIDDSRFFFAHSMAIRSANRMELFRLERLGGPVQMRRDWKFLQILEISSSIDEHRSALAHRKSLSYERT